ncbi:hypothetical protein [Planococcus lenghuensis]|uniref:Lipoprotein n=1 Tax=Planococcus lenghuensis TaxID=2213202 RepID=A0A1Q2KYC0_9BACL|nr:hypothetical protein [Planococcus lenghuensis]AQQ53126.1 hypothetical protein B0X71_08475 [Planococcus lenghuensis]
MKKKSSLAAMILIGVFLSGCSMLPPLITEDFSRLEVALGNELVIETEDPGRIQEVIQAINSSRRDETYTWELPEPIGHITFWQGGEVLELPLYEEGGVTLDQYFIYAELDF